MNNLGNVEYCEGNYEDAEKLHTEGLEIKRGIGDRIGISYSLNNLGNISLKRQRPGDTSMQLREALEIARQLDSKFCMLAPLAISTCLFAGIREYQVAALLHFGTLAQLKRTGLALDPMDGGMLEEGAFVTRKALRESELNQLRKEAESKSLEELVDYTLTELRALSEQPWRLKPGRTRRGNDKRPR